jgi:GTP-binding protein
LIEGASDGAGLGFRFLKHLSRTTLLLHLVDAMPADGGDPVDASEKIIKELEKFSPALSRKERWLVINKSDLLDDADLKALEKALRKKLDWDKPIHKISSLTKEGCENLVRDLMGYIDKHRNRLKKSKDYRIEVEDLENALAFEIRKKTNNALRAKLSDEVFQQS